MKPVIVVEGKTDVQRLQNLINADFVICNGSAINEDTLNYIEELSHTRKVIIFTDPDYPGLQIRNKISNRIKNVYHAFVDRTKASNGKKLGIAECEKEEILKALKDYVYLGEEKDNISMQDFISLGLSGDKNSSLLREKVSKKLSLGYGNSKTILKRINMLNISLDELKEIVNDCK